MSNKTNGILAGAVLFTAFIAMVGMASCKKGDSFRQTNLRVYLTDHPAEFDNVMVNIVSVEAKIDSGRASCKDDRHGDRPEKFDHDGDDHHRRSDAFGYWTPLGFGAGTYDVLALRNGVDTLLGSVSFSGMLRKIRIGVTSVTVVKAGVSYPVVLDPTMQNYLYVRVHVTDMDHRPDSSHVWVDFDLGRSIVESNGKFYLRPVLKPFNDRSFGGIEGGVTPKEAGAVVTAFGATDTATAIPDARGHYCIRGLDPGSYRIVFDGNNGYADKVVSNVSVTRGQKTRVEDVVLTK
jgi:hypothetical protein